MVVHAYNPSYLGSGDRKIADWPWTKIGNTIWKTKQKGEKEMDIVISLLLIRYRERNSKKITLLIKSRTLAFDPCPPFFKNTLYQLYSSCL
jgi:hypothetical protein